jgi:hypothetical protein
MQITLLSFLFKKINIIKKGINIKDTLKLYAVLFSCFIYSMLSNFRTVPLFGRNIFIAKLFYEE